MGSYRAQTGIEGLVTPDLIRGPRRQRCYGSRIKSGMTKEVERTVAFHPKPDICAVVGTVWGQAIGSALVDLISDRATVEFISCTPGSLLSRSKKNFS